MKNTISGTKFDVVFSSSSLPSTAGYIWLFVSLLPVVMAMQIIDDSLKYSRILPTIYPCAVMLALFLYLSLQSFMISWGGYWKVGVSKTHLLLKVAGRVNLIEWKNVKGVSLQNGSITRYGAIPKTIVFKIVNSKNNKISSMKVPDAFDVPISEILSLVEQHQEQYA